MTYDSWQEPELRPRGLGGEQAPPGAGRGGNVIWYDIIEHDVLDKYTLPWCYVYAIV